MKGTPSLPAGKPAGGGEITFDPANINRKDVTARTSKIGSDGSYTVTTLTGDNSVTVRASVIGATPSSRPTSGP